MSKAVMMSIQPRFCELIANGKKTIEIRKTRPKLQMPFKVYIYCTKAKKPIKEDGQILMYADDLAITNRWGRGEQIENPNGWLTDKELLLNGKVIGYFVCDDIDELHEYELTPQGEHYLYEKAKLDFFLHTTCLSYGEICDYRKNLPYHKPLYAWHISNLVIYDQPKELWEFKFSCIDDYLSGRAFKKQLEFPHSEDICYLCDILKPLKRPPQSWCYVEEQDND